jgi:predicted aminopeptidase
VKQTFVLALVTVGALGSSGCWTTRYLLQQGAGQFRLLHDRQRIRDVLADPATDADIRRRLALAQSAREFGVEVLGLRGGDNFTRFLDLHGKPLAWNLSAAPKDKLRPVVWRFPITGAVPYLGFFREEDARREAAALRARGLDVYVREVVGYSTLGITSDPVYSSMLEGPPERIVEVVLHEMLHGTLWIPGRSDFNESLATFVGLQGAALYFMMAGRGGAAARRVLESADRRRKGEAAFRAYLKPFLAELEALYKSDLSRDEKIARREEIFARAKEEFLRRFPQRPGRPSAFLNVEGGGLNNAVFAAYAVYHKGTGDHDRIFQKVGRDLRRFIEVYKTAAERDNPFEYLRARFPVKRK